MSDDRAVRSLVDVVAVEQVAPGLVEVVTWSDAYHVDARDAGCNCPDQEYNLDAGGMCKHEYAALVADVDTIPTPFEVTDDLSRRAVADGGERPDDCDCWSLDPDLPCWPCYRDGFETPNPDAEDDDATTGTDTPTRSEPADFGGGDSTGVKDLL
jgi:hypothetical protein